MDSLSFPLGDRSVGEMKLSLSLDLNYSTCSIERAVSAASTGLNIKGQLEPVCASVPGLS